MYTLTRLVCVFVWMASQFSWALSRLKEAEAENKPGRWCTWRMWEVDCENAQPLWKYSGPICWCVPGPVREDTNLSVWARETPDITQVYVSPVCLSLTFDNNSSWSVLTPKRFPAPPEILDVWLTFLTPLICVIIPPCCCCCCCCCWPCLLFLSLAFGTGHGSSNSFCLSGENRINIKKGGFQDEKAALAAIKLAINPSMPAFCNKNTLVTKAGKAKK